MTDVVSAVGGIDRLQRACRLAGESFGHEDATLPAGRGSLAPRVAWIGCLFALVGLAWLVFN